ncbi:MAG: tRNA epoxyqueuosine(34) reductase QueG [Tissierellaceae bacterium]
MNKLNEYIVAKSKEVGIDICKFTDSSPLINLRAQLQERKKEEKMTEFEEGDIEKRIDPRLTLPSCKSIIVLGISYNVDYSERPDYKLRGRLSMSSWGQDYHRVLKDRIEKLIGEITKVGDFQYKYFVDTGPLVDRELAVKAGLGYYGKNCSVINEEYGSFIFIGYILTDLDLDYDSPVESQCGDCDLCLRACPTGALEGAGSLNPKKCISYLTQTKEEIPVELKNKMGIKIYGCDTCQLVCPKNKVAKKSSHKEFIPYETKGYIDLEELLGMSNSQFKRKYGHMSGSWRGKNILKRNAQIIKDNIFLTESPEK